MTDSLVHSSAQMGTVVTIQLVGHGGTSQARAEREAAAQRALAWFDAVTAACSRFAADSELSVLTTRVGEAVAVSDLLFEALRFALRVADDTDGVFDPTVGRPMEQRGFDREFRTGRSMQHDAADSAATWRDVQLDETARRVTLLRPLVLDLGAVAKGLAVDMAARALQGFENFAIDAGGDLYLAGQNVHGEPWSVGIRHPRTEGALWTTLRVSNAAVCTSGDYARVSAVPNGGHHIVEAQRASGDARAASVTVIAPTAMVADALSTAAFALGPVQGISFLERHGADGFIVTTELEQIATRGMRTDIVSDTPAVH